jgi:serine/threonine protein phosphatase 1
MDIERVAVFGDVHGRPDMLSALLIEIRKQFPGIEIYSTGDLVDRGYNSNAVVGLIIQAGVKPVRGNHDDVFDRVLNDFKPGDLAIHLYDGMKGMPTARSYGLDVKSPWQVELSEYLAAVPDEHKAFFRSLPVSRQLYVGGRNYLISHAGLSEMSWLDAQDDFKNEEFELEDLIEYAVQEHLDDVLWEHKRRGYARIPGYTQVVGHLPVTEPYISDDVIMIDTGCGHDGRPLTAIILPDNILIQVTDER